MNDAVPCLTCGGTKGHNIPYGDSAGWRECSSCDGTGVRRSAPHPPTRHGPDESHALLLAAMSPEHRRQSEERAALYDKLDQLQAQSNLYAFALEQIAYGELNATSGDDAFDQVREYARKALASATGATTQGRG